MTLPEVLRSTIKIMDLSSASLDIVNQLAVLQVLEELNINAVYITTELLAPLSHNNLKRLSLKNPSPDTIRVPLNMAKLEHISLSNILPEIGPEQGGNVTSLELLRFPPEQLQFLTKYLFKDVPKLDQLSIELNNFDDEGVVERAVLASLNSNRELCPNLKSIILTVKSVKVLKLARS